LLSVEAFHFLKGHFQGKSDVDSDCDQANIAHLPLDFGGFARYKSYLLKYIPYLSMNED
jgi:hypothetical protein